MHRHRCGKLFSILSKPVSQILTVLYTPYIIVCNFMLHMTVLHIAVIPFPWKIVEVNVFEVGLIMPFGLIFGCIASLLVSSGSRLSLLAG